MSDEPNANLDPLFRRDRDPNAVAESEAQMWARNPELEEFK